MRGILYFLLLSLLYLVQAIPVDVEIGEGSIDTRGASLQSVEISEDARKEAALEAPQSTQKQAQPLERIASDLLCCLVCYDPLPSNMKADRSLGLNCGHQKEIHPECLKEWFKTCAESPGGIRSCPKCRLAVGHPKPPQAVIEEPGRIVRGVRGLQTRVRTNLSPLVSFLRDTVQAIQRSQPRQNNVQHRESESFLDAFARRRGYNVNTYFSPLDKLVLIFLYILGDWFGGDRCFSIKLGKCCKMTLVAILIVAAIVAIPSSTSSRRSTVQFAPPPSSLRGLLGYEGFDY